MATAGDSGNGETQGTIMNIRGTTTCPYRSPLPSPRIILVLLGLPTVVQRRRPRGVGSGVALVRAQKHGPLPPYSLSSSSSLRPSSVFTAGGVAVASSVERRRRALASISPASSISGYAFFDSYGDGNHDVATSAGIYDASVRLFSCADEMINATKTDSSGYYEFENIAGGQYYIIPMPPAWYTFGDVWNGKAGENGVLLHPDVDSAVDPQTGRTSCFDLEGGEDKTVSFGMTLGVWSPPSRAPTNAPVASPSASPSKFANFRSLEPTTPEPPDPPISLAPQLPSMPSALPEPSERPNPSAGLPSSSSSSFDTASQPTPKPTFSSRPTVMPSSRSGALHGPIVTKQLVMIIRGIEMLEDEEAWSAATSAYIMAYFNLTITDLGISNVTVGIEVTSQRSSNDTLFRGRRLQSDFEYVEVSYVQTSTYRTPDPIEYDGVYVATRPFSTQRGSEGYVVSLQSLSPHYEDVWSVGLIRATDGGGPAEFQNHPGYGNEENGGIPSKDEEGISKGNRMSIVLGIIGAALLANALVILGIKWREYRREELLEARTAESLEKSREGKNDSAIEDGEGDLEAGTAERLRYEVKSEVFAQEMVAVNMSKFFSPDDARGDVDEFGEVEIGDIGDINMEFGAAESPTTTVHTDDEAETSTLLDETIEYFAQFKSNALDRVFGS